MRSHFWDYSFILPLPQNYLRIVEVNKEVSFGQDIQLAAAFSEKEGEFFLPAYLDDPHNRHLAQLEIGNVRHPNHVPVQYLQVFEQGFVQSGPSMTEESAMSKVKAFFGLGITFGLFRVSPFPRPPTPQPYAVYRQGENGWALCDEKKWLPPSIAEIYGRLLRDESHASEAVQGAADKFSCVFQGGATAQRLLLAAEWLFSSFSMHDRLLAFVQAVVVLEILLGDKAITDVIGIGELIRNRCAFLLGRTQTERHSILKSFNEIYKVRSEVVHAGKKHLNARELGLFQQLQDLCIQVIKAEVRLLKNEAGLQEQSVLP